MQIRDTNIFFNKQGQKTLSIGGGINFCAFGISDMLIEAPAVIVGNKNASHIAAKRIGAFSFINQDAQIRFVESIGRFCSIAEECRLGLGVHPKEAFSSSDALYAANRWKEIMTFCRYNEFDQNKKKLLQKYDDFKMKITIGNDVWIGQGVKICKSVTIGDGAIIAAGAVVTRDVEPYAVVAGIPAKMIKRRFSNDIIAKLLELRWWDYGLDILEGIDITDITMEKLRKIEQKIQAGFPKYEGIQYKFTAEGKVYKMEEKKVCIVYSTEKEIKKGGVSGGGAHFNSFTGKLSMYGWFLPSYVYDEIRIYDGEYYLGNANLHCLRTDVAENFPEYGDARSGWKFQANLRGGYKSWPATMLHVQ